MFNNLTGRLSAVVKNLSGRARLSEENIEEALRDVRIALLEADVGLEVVRDFIADVRARAVGQDVIGTLTPGQALIRVVRDELTRLMGDENRALDLASTPPVVVLLNWMVLLRHTAPGVEEPPDEFDPSTQLDVDPDKAKLYNVPLFPLLVLSVKVVNPVFVPPAVP